jgi:ferredoxin
MGYDPQGPLHLLVLREQDVFDRDQQVAAQEVEEVLFVGPDASKEHPANSSRSPNQSSVLPSYFTAGRQSCNKVACGTCRMRLLSSVRS